MAKLRDRCVTRVAGKFFVDLAFSTGRSLSPSSRTTLLVRNWSLALFFLGSNTRLGLLRRELFLLSFFLPLQPLQERHLFACFGMSTSAATEAAAVAAAAAAMGTLIARATLALLVL